MPATATVTPPRFTTAGYRQLVRQLTPLLLRHAARLAGDGEAAEELVQQTLIRLWQIRDRVGDRPVAGLAVRILTDLARNHWRNTARRTARERRAASARPGSEADAGSDPQLALLAGEAWELAMQLPDTAREVLVQHYALGRSLRETADALGLPEGTVKTRHRSAIARLRERLAVSGLAVPTVYALARLLGTTEGIQPPTPAACQSVEAIVMRRVTSETLGGFTFGFFIAVAVALMGLTLLGQPGAVPDSDADIVADAPDQPDAPAPPDPAGPDDDDDLPGTATPPVIPDNDGELPVNGNGDGANANAPAASGVEGRVVDTAGRGIAGIRLLIGVPQGVPMSAAEFALHLPVGTVTDGQGRFRVTGLHRAPEGLDTAGGRDRFAVTVPFVAEPEPPANRRTYRAMQIHGPNSLTYLRFNRQRSFTLQPGRIVEVDAIVLTRPGAIEGTVRDADGNPVAGATVAAEGDYHQMWSIIQAKSVRTDAHGRFLLDDLTPGSHSLTVTAEGRDELEVPPVDVPEGGTGGPVELVFPARAAVGERRARVTDAEGNPVADALVWVLINGSARGNVRTGADGEAALPDVGRSDVEVLAAARGYAVDSRVVDLIATPVVDLVLTRAARLTGRLVDSGGEPVAEAELILNHEHVETDADGRFAFEPVQPGAAWLVLRWRMNHMPLMPVALETGGTTDLGDVAMPAATRGPGEGEGREVARVSVLDGRGRPVADAQVMMGTMHRLRDDQVWRTDRSGEAVVTVRYLDESRPVVLIATGPDGRRGSSGLVRFTPGHVARASIWLEPAGQVHARIVRQGRPAPDVEVRLVPLPTSLHGLPRLTATSDRDGRITFADVAPGRWQLAAQAGGNRTVMSDTIAVASGATAEATLTVDSPDLTVELVNPDGRPASGCNVEVSNGNGEWAPMPSPWAFGGTGHRVDRSGRIVLRDAARMGVALRVTGHDGTAFLYRVTPQLQGARTVELVVPDASGSVAGRVTDANGRALAGVTVTVSPLARYGLIGRTVQKNRHGWQQPCEIARTDADGRYRIDGLAPGDYHVECHRRGGETGGTDVAVVANETAQAAFALEPRVGHLALRIDATGSAFPEFTVVRVTARAVGTDQTRRLTVRPVAMLDGLRADETWEVTVEVDGHTPWVERIRIDADRIVDRVAVLTPGD